MVGVNHCELFRLDEPARRDTVCRHVELRRGLKFGRREWATRSLETAARKAVAEGRVTSQGTDIFVDGRPCKRPYAMVFRLVLREVEAPGYPSATEVERPPTGETAALPDDAR